MSRKKTVWYWVAYPDGIEKVQLIEMGVGDRIVKRGFFKKPVTVENEEGDEYIVSHHELYHSPIAASIQVAKLREELGLGSRDDDDLPTKENPIDVEDEDEDDPDEDDPDEDDPDEDVIGVDDDD
jgi:hypothetical protein